MTEADQGVERALRTLLIHGVPTTLNSARSTAPGPLSRPLLDHRSDRRHRQLPARVPVWATLIGLVVDGAATLGVVSARRSGGWWAADGQARTSDVNGRVRRLRTSAVSEWSDAPLAYSDPIGWAPGALGRLADGAWRTRGYGDFPRTCWWRRARSMWRSSPTWRRGTGGAAAHRGGRRRPRQRHDRRRRDRLGRRGRPPSVAAGLISSNALLHDEAVARYAGSPDPPRCPWGQGGGGGRLGCRGVVCTQNRPTE